MLLDVGGRALYVDCVKKHATRRAAAAANLKCRRRPADRRSSTFVFVLPLASRSSGNGPLAFQFGVVPRSSSAFSRSALDRRPPFLVCFSARSRRCWRQRVCARRANFVALANELRAVYGIKHAAALVIPELSLRTRALRAAACAYRVAAAGRRQSRILKSGGATRLHTSRVARSRLLAWQQSAVGRRPPGSGCSLGRRCSACCGPAVTTTRALAAVAVGLALLLSRKNRGYNPIS